MNARLSSDYPGLFGFTALLILSLTVFTVLPGNPQIIGFLWLVWALFGLFRAAWLAESAFAAAQTRRRILPWLLLDHMQTRRRAEAARRALRSVNRINLGWLACMAGFAFYALYAALHPAQAALAMPWQDIAAGFGRLCIAGLMFWLVQSYGYAQNYMRGLITLLSFAFGALAVGAFLLLGPVLPGDVSSFALRLAETGYAGFALLYAGGAVLGALFLCRLMIGPPQGSGYAFWGLAVLAVLMLCDTALPHDPRLFGLFLTGWILLALLLPRLLPQTRNRRDFFRLV